MRTGAADDSRSNRELNERESGAFLRDFMQRHSVPLSDDDQIRAVDAPIGDDDDIPVDSSLDDADVG